MSKPMKLLNHPSTLSGIPTPSVRVGRNGQVLRVTYRIPGDTSMVAFPERIEPFAKRSEQRRADRLWEHTCFEAFVRTSEGSRYFELNFSPSSEWAAYAFDDYRKGMRSADIEIPAVHPTAWANRFELSARVVLPPDWVNLTWLLNLTAVIEERDGTKSYWALSHPPDGPPDFHHPACFTLELPPPSEA
ncbi:MAG: DOMON-like domain-containing protein [Allosphingosinicella sp.]|uniref:DOMON-like domain-containing protein n=1 Tax=Allosphingosinicella sp. TaxID=2823234 RepID=UPI003959D87D